MEKNQLSHLIQRATHSQTALVENVRVAHGGFNIFVAEEFLHGADVVTVFKKVRGKGMAKGVGADPFGNPRLLGCAFDRLLDTALMKVLAAQHPAAWIHREPSGRKNPLPKPFAVGTGILSL